MNTLIEFYDIRDNTSYFYPIDRIIEIRVMPESSNPTLSVVLVTYTFNNHIEHREYICNIKRIKQELRDKGKR